MIPCSGSPTKNMNFSTSQLGIYELVGYLFSGIYVIFVLVLPFVFVEANANINWVNIFNIFDDIQKSTINDALKGVALLIFVYATGVLASQFSYMYYDRIRENYYSCYSFRSY